MATGRAMASNMFASPPPTGPKVERPSGGSNALYRWTDCIFCLRYPIRTYRRGCGFGLVRSHHHRFSRRGDFFLHYVRCRIEIRQASGRLVRAQGKVFIMRAIGTFALGISMTKFFLRHSGSTDGGSPTNALARSHSGATQWRWLFPSIVFWHWGRHSQVTHGKMDLIQGHQSTRHVDWEVQLQHRSMCRDRECLLLF